MTTLTRPKKAFILGRMEYKEWSSSMIIKFHNMVKYIMTINYIKNKVKGYTEKYQDKSRSYSKGQHLKFPCTYLDFFHFLITKCIQ